MDMNKINEQIIKEFVKDKYNKEAYVESRLMGGMSNFTYIIVFDKHKYTFRIPGKGAEIFTNRVTELSVVEDIKPYNFQPDPILFDVETGYKIAPFINGISVNEMDDKPLEDIAAVLKRLHGLPKFSFDYDPVGRLNKYDSVTNNDDPVYLTLKSKWMDIYNNFLSKIPLVPSHGDSQTSNFVLGQDDILYLLDWEFAANNDPIYDIACYGNANFEHAKALIEVYYDKVEKEHWLRLYAWRMFQCLQWHNVAKYKHQIGLSEDLSIDFDFFANQYLEKAKGFYQNYLEV